MIEFAIRVLFALATVGLTAWAQPTQLELVSKIAAVFGAYSFFQVQLEQRNIRSAQLATLFAVFDCFSIAGILGATGRLEELGFLVLAPLANACSRFGASPSILAPLAAGSLIMSNILFTQSATPSLLLGAQTILILLTGLLATHRTQIIRVAEPVLPVTVEPLETPMPDDTLELRESYRVLKDLYRDLEVRSKRDRVVAQVVDETRGEKVRFHKRFAMSLRESLGVNSLALYTLSQMQDQMVVRSVSGDYPSDLRDSSVPVDLRMALKQIAEQASHALAAMNTGKSNQLLENVILRHENKVVGMVALMDEDQRRLESAKQLLEQMAHSFAQMLVEEERGRSLELRVRESELLYEMSASLSGAKTPTQLASRALAELSEMIDADHMGIFWIDQIEAIAAEQKGVPMKFHEALSFGTGPGIPGWLEAGSPEIWMPDTHRDSRCSSTEAIKRRCGSFGLFPIQFEDEPYGFLTVGTHRAGGVDVEEVEFLRSLANEMAHAIAAMRLPDTENCGLATPAEFKAATENAKRGHFIYLQPIRKEAIIDQYGKPQFEKALRQYAQKLKSKLPANAIACRRADGDFVALLRNGSADFATSWANEAAAMASFIGLKDSKSGVRIPLAMRARVAQIHPQKPRISSEAVA